MPPWTPIREAGSIVSAGARSLGEDPSRRNGPSGTPRPAGNPGGMRGAGTQQKRPQNPRIASAPEQVKPLRGSYAALRPCG